MGRITKDTLSEQERVASLASMFAITQAVMQGGHQEIIDVASGIELESIDLAKILDLPLEVVNAALDNLEEDGKLTVEEREDLDDEES